VAAAYVAVKFRPSYGTYVWVGILVPLSSIFEGRPLIAFSRYVVVLFPIYWAAARWTERRPARHELLVASSAALLGLMTLLFVTWYYVI
jgi:hypothetical protein